MPGVKGAGGPPPKRQSQRRRANKPKVPVETAAAALDVVAPKADRKWHPIAKHWYESLAASGQSKFYEPSDWMTAFAVAESMSREFRPQFVGLDEKGKPVVMALPPKAASLAAWLKASTVLLATEGDRRRLRLELTKTAGGGEAEPDGVSELDEYRRRLQSG